MSRLTEKDKQVIGRLYQGQLSESVARECNLAVSTISKRLKSLDTNVAGIRKAYRSGTSLNKLLISLEGNGADTAPPPHHGYSITNSIGSGFHREASRQHRVQAGRTLMTIQTYIPHFNEAVAEATRKAAEVSLADFIRSFEALPNPKYVPHVTHPQQVEITEAY